MSKTSFPPRVLDQARPVFARRHGREPTSEELLGFVQERDHLARELLNFAELIHRVRHG